LELEIVSSTPHTQIVAPCAVTFTGRNADSTTFQLLIAAGERSPAKHETQSKKAVKTVRSRRGNIILVPAVVFPVNATNKSFFFATNPIAESIGEKSP
jgi:hypothetical protein